jgi:hypothetical protein
LRGESMLVRRLYICTLLFAVLAFVCTAQAQSTPEAAVRTFMDGFNSGDMAKSAAVNSPSGTSIIDEFAPYAWSGPKAFDEWGAAFEADAKAVGLTEPRVTLSAPIVKNLTSEQAYLIYPSVYTYKLKGVSMRETGHIAIVLRQETSVWKIAAWTWTGTVPKPVK